MAENPNQPAPSDRSRPDGTLNRGGQKLHTVINPDGTTGQMTQEQWKARDKRAGYRRPDDSELPDDGGETGGTAPPA